MNEQANLSAREPLDTNRHVNRLLAVLLVGDALAAAGIWVWQAVAFPT